MGTKAELNPYSQMKEKLHQCENIILITIFPETKAMPSSHKLDYILGKRSIESEVHCVITLARMLEKDDNFFV